MQGSGENRQVKVSSGLHQSPSVISLHDQAKSHHSREQIQLAKKRSSKDSSVRRNQNRALNSSELDEYAEEVSIVTGQYPNG